MPAENAAISQGVSPDQWTWSNIKHMKEQLLKLGISFDWQRELATCSPDYYKWTQFIFLKLFENGLAYQKSAFVNWDPVDQTVLAEEQVDANGCSWRSGAKVVKKPLKQWYIKTTRFTSSLAQGLDELSAADWGDIIKLQKHWIGDCNGYRFDLPVVGTGNAISVWTANPETLKTAAFIAIKPEHILYQTNHAAALSVRPANATKLDLVVENPLTKRNLPVIVTDLLDYPEGSETVFGDPSCDEKAADLARQLCLASDHSEWAQVSLNREQICTRALAENWGGYKTSSKLRDWLISRQRYWGTPIPIVHCDHCGPVPVPASELPVSLPPSDATGHSSLLHNEHFFKVDCYK